MSKKSEQKSKQSFPVFSFFSVSDRSIANVLAMLNTMLFNSFSLFFLQKTDYNFFSVLKFYHFSTKFLPHFLGFFFPLYLKSLFLQYLLPRNNSIIYSNVLKNYICVFLSMSYSPSTSIHETIPMTLLTPHIQSRTNSCYSPYSPCLIINLNSPTIQISKFLNI